MKRVELSCDLGEARDEAEEAREEELWPLVDAANVACGGHVGDEASMRVAVRRAELHGVLLGAHPSYPDREGFGRRSLSMAPTELRGSLAEQIAALRAVAGDRLARVKPHGALYNDAHRDAALAAVIVEAVRDVDRGLALVAAPGSALLYAARAAGLGTIAEAFADRRYRSDGSLVPRSAAGSLLIDPEEAAAQARRLAETSSVIADDGTTVRIAFDTLCVHGDMEGTIDRILAIRRVLGGRASGEPAIC